MSDTMPVAVPTVWASSAPGAPTSVVAIGGVEQVTLTWTVPASGASPIASFSITPMFGGVVAQTPVVVSAGAPGSALDPTGGATDFYVLTGLLVGRYTFTVAASNASETGVAGTSNATDIVSPMAQAITPASNLPHLALPLQIGPGGAFATNQQDSLSDVAQSVEVILGTTVGTRPMVPGFGVPPLLFAETAPSPKELLAAVQRWDARGVVEIIISNDGNGVVQVNADVALPGGR